MSGLCKYEELRLANIARNHEILKKLGLVPERLSASVQKPKKKRKKKRSMQNSNLPRRRSRRNSHKTKPNYAEVDEEGKIKQGQTTSESTDESSDESSDESRPKKKRKGRKGRKYTRFKRELPKGTTTTTTTTRGKSVKVAELNEALVRKINRAGMLMMENCLRGYPKMLETLKQINSSAGKRVIFQGARGEIWSRVLGDADMFLVGTRVRYWGWLCGSGETNFKHGFLSILHDDSPWCVLPPRP